MSSLRLANKQTNKKITWCRRHCLSRRCCMFVQSYSIILKPTINSNDVGCLGFFFFSFFFLFFTSCVLLFPLVRFSNTHSVENFGYNIIDPRGCSILEVLFLFYLYFTIHHVNSQSDESPIKDRKMYVWVKSLFEIFRFWITACLPSI